MRVQICTPSLEGIPSLEYQTSIIRTNNLLLQHGHYVDLNFIRGDQFISKARNGLVKGFIESPEKPDVLFFIDDDEGWDDQAFLRMCLDPHGIVAAAVPKKTDTGEFNNVLLATEEDSAQCVIENGMIRAKQIGTGFMAIKRWALEKMIEAYPEQYRPGDGGPHPEHYNLFDARVHWPDDPVKALEVIERSCKLNDTTLRLLRAAVSLAKPAERAIGQFWGEDLDFCRKWCALGEYIWIDPNVEMTHAGRKVYRGNFLEYLQKTCQVEMNMPPAPPAPEAIPETLEAIERLAA